MTKALVSISFVVLCIQSAVHRGGDRGGGGGWTDSTLSTIPIIHHCCLMADNSAIELKSSGSSYFPAEKLIAVSLSNLAKSSGKIFFRILAGTDK